jgi:hypothetical protein
MADQQTPSSSGTIVATADRTYRLKRFALVLILLVYGGLSIRDGFVKYPADNARARTQGLDIMPHPGYDVQLNKYLGMILPPLALVFFSWTFYVSRGKYRFDGSAVHVPGHPAVPLIAMRKIDRSKWDRKGIAYVEYQFPGTSKGGTFKLDDFVYQRNPTDQIFARIDAALGNGPAMAGVPATPLPAPPVRPPGVVPPAAIPAKPRPGPTR